MITIMLFHVLILFSGTIVAYKRHLHCCNDTIMIYDIFNFLNIICTYDKFWHFFDHLCYIIYNVKGYYLLCRGIK